MLNHARFSISLVVVFIAMTMGMMFSCNEQPTALDIEEASGLGGSGEIDPGTSGAFLLGEVSDTSIAAGTIEVWAMNVAFDDSLGLVTFDAQILNRTDHPIAPPIRFVIRSIAPRDVGAVDFDGISRDGFPFYDFSAKLGDDNLLTPGERTGRVTMKFHTVTARSFAIGFRIDIGQAAGRGTIGGIVFSDDNQDGIRECGARCELGIPGITVALETKLSNGDMVTLITRTDKFGAYRFDGRAAGVYKVFVSAPDDLWKITSANPLLVTLVADDNGNVQSFLGANFGLYALLPPTITLFGPVLVGPFSPNGTELDSTFVNPPSPLTVVFNYYIEALEPPYMMPVVGSIDSAEAWINSELVFQYASPDTVFSGPRIAKIRDGLVQEGENSIHILTAGGENTALMWRVYKRP